MSYVIRKVSVPGRSARADLTTAADLAAAAAQGYELAGDYLQWFDVDAKFGKGDDRWTSDPAKALRFKTVEKAIEAWRTQSKLVPYRSDGKPNRPLMAYSITFEVAHEPEISDVLYILLDRTPIAVDLKTWAKYFETFENRHLFSEYVGRSLVSTVFLGLDHNFSSKGDPILFETMVFEGPLAGEMMRYRSYADAARGHAAMVVDVRKACAQIKAIADQAGATSPMTERFLVEYKGGNGRWYPVRKGPARKQFAVFDSRKAAEAFLQSFGSQIARIVQWPRT